MNNMTGAKTRNQWGGEPFVSCFPWNKLFNMPWKFVNVMPPIVPIHNGLFVDSMAVTVSIFV